MFVRKLRKIGSGTRDIWLLRMLSTRNRGIVANGSPWMPQILLLSSFNSTNQSSPRSGLGVILRILFPVRSSTSKFRTLLRPTLSRLRN